MRCYLCNHVITRFRKGIVRDDPSLLIGECAECGLIGLSSSDHIRPGHYENSGMHGSEPRSIESLLREAERDDHRRFEALKSIIEDRKVLDFGCGAAGFLLKAREVAAQAAGVEVERRILDYWNGRLDLYGGLSYVTDTYNVITAFHVLEHLPDPRSTLRELGLHLAGGGRLVVEVPNSEDALLTLYDCDAFQKFTYWSQHLFLFNAETLSRLAGQAGFRVLALQQFQRYPLSNHLHWLSRNKPVGHQRWAFLDSTALTDAYGNALAAIGKCDTLIAHLECVDKCE